MRILLDTHTLIWALSKPEKLSSKVVKLISNVNNLVFVSIASLWELQIKKSLNKITLPDNFPILLQDSGYKILNITLEHILQLEPLPLLHRDPFDRMLIAQSISEKIPLVTDDSEILQYTFEKITF